MKATKGKIEIRNGKGEHLADVQGYSFKHTAYHRTLNADGEPTDVYTVTHLPTGKAFHRAIPTQKEARGLAIHIERNADPLDVAEIPAGMSPLLQHWADVVRSFYV